MSYFRFVPNFTKYLSPLLFVFSLQICAESQVNTELLAQRLFKSQLLHDFKTLSGRKMAGRKPGTEGHKLAQAYIENRYHEIGLKPFDGTFSHRFEHKRTFGSLTGYNLIGYLEGSNNAEKFIVVTAHYDHLGKQQGRLHLGADDNASGVAALLSLAQSLSDMDHSYSYIFIATDLEENGLYGAHNFVANPPVSIEKIKLNINLDMLSQFSRRPVLYVAGTRRLPWARSLVRNLQNNLNSNSFKLELGHEKRNLRTLSSNSRGVDWLKASDHYAFHKRGIPYLYFGVDTHKHYHKATDTYENAKHDFYVEGVKAIVRIVSEIDKQPSLSKNE